MASALETGHTGNRISIAQSTINELLYASEPLAELVTITCMPGKPVDILELLT